MKDGSKRTMVQDLHANVGEKVEVWGWVYRHRTTKNAVFVIVRDSTGIVQCVFKPDSEAFRKAADLSIETSVKVRGIPRFDERAPGGIEIQGKDLVVVHKAERFPITKDQSTEFLLDMRHLWLRSQKMNKILKLRDYSIRYFREFFQNEGFWEVHPPILTKTGAEGGSTLFGLDYFGEEAYLSQTGQLYLEALIFVLERVFSLTPSFRAERSRTRKHLAEYWHLEAEAAWLDNEGNMRLQEKMVSHVVQRLIQNHGNMISDFRNLSELRGVEPPFERMSYDEAIETLQGLGFSIDWGDDFGTPHEEALTRDMEKPLFVYNWPKQSKAFYMMQDPNRPEVVKCADLLAPKGHGELIGGSERIWDLDELIKKIREFGLKPENYEWYVDLRRYGSVPHSGFGLGTERFLKWVLNLDHIRDTLPFPRTINRVYP